MAAVAKHIPDWTHWMRVHGQSSATVQSYGYQLKHFVAFCGLEGVQSVEDVDRECLRRYWTWLKTSATPCSAHSLGVKCRAVKSFFAFLVEGGVLTDNPANILKSPSTQGVLPKRAPRHEDVKRLLELPDPRTKQGLRDRAALELGYSSGLRVGEIERLSIFDVDLQGGVVAVRQGKGGKDRLCPLGLHATRCLRLYLEQSRPKYREASAGETDALFLSNRGTRWGRQDMQRVMRGYRQRAGLSDLLTPHGLRRGMATGMISRLQKNGRGEAADMVTVSAILGHRSFYTTAKYAQVLAEDLKDVHQATHPRSKTTEAASEALHEFRTYR